MVELHSELRTALTHGTERVHIAEHICKRNHGVDDRGIAAHLLTEDLAAAAG